jgi:hypothetical protein
MVEQPENMNIAVTTINKEILTLNIIPLLCAFMPTSMRTFNAYPKASILLQTAAKPYPEASPLIRSLVA